MRIFEEGTTTILFKIFYYYFSKFFYNSFLVKISRITCVRGFIFLFLLNEWHIGAIRLCVCAIEGMNDERDFANIGGGGDKKRIE